MMPLTSLLMRPRNVAVRTLKSLVEYLRPASEGQLCYIHIGKCGGATVNRAIDTSPVVAEAFDKVTVTHVARPRLQAAQSLSLCGQKPHRPGHICFQLAPPAGA